MDNKDALGEAIDDVQAKLDQFEAAFKPFVDRMKSMAKTVGKEAADRQEQVTAAMKPFVEKMEALAAEARKMTKGLG